MTNLREELLALQVNARLAERKREARWWWLRDWRDWLRGAAWGLVSFVIPMGIFFWLTAAAKDEATFVLPIGIAFLFAASGIGSGMHHRFREQQKMIERLEERISMLEERNTSGSPR